MRKPFLAGVGGILSADIAVPDHEQELLFYSKILTSGSSPLWRKDLFNNQDLPIIGLGKRSPEYESLPLQWMPHIQVSDVAVSAARTIELGGQELFHGKDAKGDSQWAVLVDPSGAAFGVVPVVTDESYSASYTSPVGCISRLSLITSDVSSMCEFYEQVIGWSAVAAETEGEFEMQREDGVVAAEIFPDNEKNENVPSVWILSLPVGDFDESLRLVREGGGAIVKHEPETGHAVIKDPVGVYIGLQAGK